MRSNQQQHEQAVIAAAMAQLARRAGTAAFRSAEHRLTDEHDHSHPTVDAVYRCDEFHVAIEHKSIDCIHNVRETDPFIREEVEPRIRERLSGQYSHAVTIVLPAERIAGNEIDRLLCAVLEAVEQVLPSLSPGRQDFFSTSHEYRIGVALGPGQPGEVQCVLLAPQEREIENQLRLHVMRMCTKALPGLARAKKQGLVTVLLLEVNDVFNENEALTAMAYRGASREVAGFAEVVDCVVRADASVLPHADSCPNGVTVLKWGGIDWCPESGEPQVSCWP